MNIAGINVVAVPALTGDEIAELDAQLLKPDGHVKLLPECELRAIPWVRLRAWMHCRARYMIPTKELVDWLRDFAYEKGDRLPWIEIGAGSGDLAHHLDIKATDSFFQRNPIVRALYEQGGQPTIVYGKNVQKYDAIEAAKKFKPHKILASWVTQKTNYADPIGQGCFGGVDEGHLLRLCKRYVFVGNETSHGNKRILSLPHRLVQPSPPIVSRGARETDRVWIWER